MFDYETLRFIWWLLIGVILVVFMISDGFDMGIGCLLPLVARNDDERRIVINSVGAHWEGNQVWLILAGGALFAAWPRVYAAAFSGFYVAMILVLCSLFFRPLAFDYTDDAFATQVEDQLLLGNEIMIAPVYTQNAIGRYVYLPEEMMFVKFLGNGNMFQEVLPKGIHYVEVALNEVPLFIRKGCAIPVADFAESIPDIKEESIRMVGYEGASYERYTDDGVSRI